jgi:hypothetical protein
MSSTSEVGGRLSHNVFYFSRGFNPELYKLLYNEIDEDLIHMTDEEWRTIIYQI